MCVITKNRICFAVCRSQKQGRPTSKVQNEMCMYSERKMKLRGFSQDTVCFNADSKETTSDLSLKLKPYFHLIVQ